MLALLLHAAAIAGTAWLASRAPEWVAPAIPVELLEEPAPAAPPAARPVLAPPPARARAPGEPQAPVPRPRHLRAPAARRPAPAAEPSQPEPAPETAGAGAAEGSPVAPAGDADHVYGEGEVDAPAAPARAIAPRYPARQQQMGREGTVMLQVTVEADGRVRESAVVQSAGADFDAAAREAIARTPFHAARREGRTVASLVNVRVRFALE